MKNILFFICIILGTVCLSCSRKTKSDSENKPINNHNIPELPRFQKTMIASDTLALNTDTLLYYQKSACFGFCPTYDYIIYQNGIIKYDGHQHIEPIGTRYGLISDAWWNELSIEIQKAKFFELENLYPVDRRMYIPDLPNTIIIIKDSGKRKSITDNHDAPKALKNFELLLETKLKEINLKKF